MRVTFRQESTRKKFLNIFSITNKSVNRCEHEQPQKKTFDESKSLVWLATSLHIFWKCSKARNLMANIILVKKFHLVFGCFTILFYMIKMGACIRHNKSGVQHNWSDWCVFPESLLDASPNEKCVLYIYWKLWIHQESRNRLKAYSPEIIGIAFEN